MTDSHLTIRDRRNLTELKAATDRPTLRAAWLALTAEDRAALRLRSDLAAHARSVLGMS